MKRQQIRIGLCLIITLILASCSGYSPYNNVERVSEETTNEDIDGKNYNAIFEAKDVSNDFKIEDEIQFIAEKVSKIDFTIINYPINTNKYTLETDKIFKEAYLKAINNMIPIKRRDTGETIFFKDLLGGKELTNDEFQDFVLKTANYYNIDFDGDGLPELSIEADGPTVLKYIPEENQVYMYYRSYDKWHVLGSGQLYYFDQTSANRIVYSYESLDNDGKVSQSISFEIYSEYDEKTANWDKERFISVDGYNSVLVTENDWDKITKSFFEAIDASIPSQTYTEVFGTLN
ncbi:hypothetical protein LBYZC6_38290 [Lacrimispora brassicae]